MDYLEATIMAYDKNWQKYEERTRDNLPTEELAKFRKLLPTGAKVLDAGCAFGNQTDLLANMGLYVEGVDLSSVFIARAQHL